ncbi:MAG: hypothetical protein CMO26_06390 [Thiotrichales bacterium]|nr:hypothetical protein [Thiotrichales bacterium]
MHVHPEFCELAFEEQNDLLEITTVRRLGDELDLPAQAAATFEQFDLVSTFIGNACRLQTCRTAAHDDHLFALFGNR